MATPKIPTYGKPEPRNWRAWIGFSVFLFVAACAFYWLMNVDTPQRSLVCDSHDNTGVSLLNFGTCRED
ncbi:MAG: hypothetical protein WAO98_10695 [Alphaproteobacteria bacterium]